MCIRDRHVIRRRISKTCDRRTVARSTAMSSRAMPPSASSVPVALGVSICDAGTSRYRHRSPSVSYTHLRAHETPEHLVCRLLLEKKKLLLLLAALAVLAAISVIA